MKPGMKLACAALAAISCALCANHANAATATLLADVGSLRVVAGGTYSSSSAIASPFGTSTFMPSVVETSTGISYELDFKPVQFFANATSSPTPQSATMDGSLQFLVTFPIGAFPAGINLTTNIFESGSWSTVGNGTVGASGTVSVTPVDPATLQPLATSISNVFGPATFATNGTNPTRGTWDLSDKLTGFSGNYSSYVISIDNTLIAQAPDSTSAASIYKQFPFRVVLTTDGSSGSGVPEPASLSLLALGGVALLARRRRA